MPPAFNLSQDQTLQFDLSKLKLILTLNLIPEPSGPETSFSSSVSTSFVLEPQRPQLPGKHQGPQRAPTPIGCRLLKSEAERSPGSSRIAFGERAAKRRDSRMFSETRQHPFLPGLPKLGIPLPVSRNGDPPCAPRAPGLA